MNKKVKQLVLLSLVASTILACLCSVPSSLLPSGSGTPGLGTPISGSNGLNATAISPVTVQLNWTAVAGATGYMVEMQVGSSEFIQLADLPADQDSFFLIAPENSQLTYRVTAVTGSVNGEVRSVSLTTGAVTPNPVTVQAHEYQGQPWQPPTPAPNTTLDPSMLYPPGFDPNNPGSFDPSSMMGAAPTASGMIGPEGGNVSVTSPDNVTYQLDVPAGAVEDSIIITLTPIQSIDNLPLSGELLGAVKIDPQGYTLDVPATLTIILPKAVPPASGTTDVAFAFNADGSEFHLVPMANQGQTSENGPDGSPRAAAVISSRMGTISPAALEGWGAHANSIQDTPGSRTVNIRNLSTLGTAPATQPEVRNLVENHPPSDPGDQLGQQVAGAQEEEELAPLPVPSDPNMVSIAQGILNSAVAAGSWSDFMAALDNFRIYLENGGKLGSRLSNLNDKIWDEMVVNAKALFEKNKLQCISKDEFNAQELAEKLSNPKDDFSRTFAGKFTQKYGNKLLQDIAQMAKKCKLYLKVTSTISYQQDKVTVSASIKANIPLNWKYDRKAGKAILYGTGKITYTLFDITGAGCSNYKLNTLSGSTFTVKRLEPIFDGTGKLVDFGMGDYSMSGLQKKISGCGGWGMSANGQTGDIWGGMYVMSHEPSDYIFKEWNLPLLQPGGAGQIAEKNFDFSHITPFTGVGNIDEHTTYTIVKSGP